MGNEAAALRDSPVRAAVRLGVGGPAVERDIGAVVARISSLEQHFAGVEPVVRATFDRILDAGFRGWLAEAYRVGEQRAPAPCGAHPNDVTRGGLRP
jgi:hypothetical protein